MQPCVVATFTPLVWRSAKNFMALLLECQMLTILFTGPFAKGQPPVCDPTAGRFLQATQRFESVALLRCDLLPIKRASASYTQGEPCSSAYPEVNSPLDSEKGLPDSTVMMVQMSSSAASTASYHLPHNGMVTKASSKIYSTKAYTAHSTNLF